MDAELKTFLAGMETRITDRVDARVSAAEERITDRVMAGVDERITASESRIMQRVDGRIDASEERMKDFVRVSVHNLETKLIGEFWKWGRTSDLCTEQD